MKITACLIAKNEERCIARCLKSVSPLVDEIVVNDTGSTDRTVEIAESLGAKVIRSTWTNNFAEARNRAWDEATGDWVLWMDADEFIRRGDQEKIRAYLEQCEKNGQTVLAVNLYNYERKKFPDEIFESGPDPVASRTFGEMWPFVKIALCRNEKKRRYVGAIHEYVTEGKDKVMQARFVENDDVVFYHDGYSSEVATAKLDRNAALMKSEIISGDAPGSVYYYLGGDYTRYGMPGVAADVFEAYVYSESHLIQYGMNGYDMLDKNAQKSGMSGARRLRNAERGIEMHPRNPTGYFLKGTVLREHYRYEEALRAYAEGLEKKKVYHNPVEKEDTSQINLHIYGCAHVANICANAHDYEKAAAFYAEAYQRIMEHEEPQEDLNIPTEVRFGGGSQSANVRVSYMNQTAEQALDRFFAYTRMMSPEDAVQNICALYGAREVWEISNQTLEALLEVLRRYRCDEVFLTFFEELYKRTAKNDINFLTMMAAVGEYRGAATQFLSRADTSGEKIYLLKAIAAAYLGGEELISALLFDIEGEGEYGRVCRAASTLDGSGLEEDDIVSCVAVGVDLLAWRGADDKVCAFLDCLCARYGEIGITRVAELLGRHLHYDAARRYFEKQIAWRRDHGGDVGGSASTLAVLYCVINDAENAKKYALEAVAHGADPRPVREHIGLLARRMPTGPVKTALKDFHKQLSAWADTLRPFDPERTVDKKMDRAARELFSLTGESGEVWTRAMRLYFAAEIANRGGRPVDAEALFCEAFETEPRLAEYLVPSARPGHGYVFSEQAGSEEALCPVCGGAVKTEQCVSLLTDASFTPELHAIRHWERCGDCGHRFSREPGNPSGSAPARPKQVKYEHPIHLREYAKILREQAGEGSSVLMAAEDPAFIRASVLCAETVCCAMSGEQAELYRPGVEVLPFEGALTELSGDRTYDVCWLGDLCARSAEPDVWVAAAAQFLEKGGLLVAKLPVLEEDGVRIERRKILRDAGCVQIYSPASVRQFFEKHGFESAEVEAPEIFAPYRLFCARKK
ncbi:glycosyltransferase family 2 protein [Oscillospiraceae bacterium OttesenSCG-928-F05]|nr:glycosyltransferase family 2 protein [Oscillospiraceae bacterium OttesenSCG-928-F05]